MDVTHSVIEQRNIDSSTQKIEIFKRLLRGFLECTNTGFFYKFPRWLTEIIASLFPLYCTFKHANSFSPCQSPSIENKTRTQKKKLKRTKSEIDIKTKNRILLMASTKWKFLCNENEWICRWDGVMLNVGPWATHTPLQLILWSVRSDSVLHNTYYTKPHTACGHWFDAMREVYHFIFCCVYQHHRNYLNRSNFVDVRKWEKNFHRNNNHWWKC